MTEMEHLDIRTVTLGLSLRDCVSETIERTAERVTAKIHRYADRLVETVDQIGNEYGIRIANKRIAVTPISMIVEGASGDSLVLARAIDKVAAEVGVDFLGGYSALVHKGITDSEREFLNSIPEALATTQRLCSSVNVATTRAGINMDAVAHIGRLIKEAAERTSNEGGLACAKFVCFANSVEDNPFMAGAFHGPGEAEAVINCGVSGPGVVPLCDAACSQGGSASGSCGDHQEAFVQAVARRRVGGQGSRASPRNPVWDHRSITRPHSGTRRLSGKHYRSDGI
jgi:uncharacterized protein